MQSVSNCNYTIIYNSWQKKELFSHLLERLPKEVNYAYTKEDLKYKRKDLNYKAIQKGKFLYYNKILITELIFDIDNISHPTTWNLDWIYEIFYKKFNIPITWSCKTDKGIQFCISLNTFYQLTTKQQKLLKDFKKFIANNWELIDNGGSNRLRGWWRNPLTQTEFRYYGNILNFKEIKEFLFQNKLTIRQQFKAKNRKKLIQNNILYNNQKGGVNEIKNAKNINKTGGVENNSIRATIGEPVKGNRNNFVWYNTMLNCNSKNYNTILEVAMKLNEMCDEKLDEKEVLHIVKNVYKYNTEDKNYIYQNSKKAKWNIGVMGFEKIRGLNKVEYIKEIKRRQSMAGKRNAEIGKNNLIKAVNNKAQVTKQKVYKAIQELKTQGKRVSALGISKLAGVSRNSASKYLKQAREEGLI